MGFVSRGSLVLRSAGLPSSVRRAKDFCFPIEPPLEAGDVKWPWRFARFDNSRGSFKARGMPTSEHYRKSAQECRRLAKETDDTD